MGDDREESPIEAVLALLASVRRLAPKLDDVLVERLLAAFGRLPASDRETILAVIERDATWCRIVEQTADTTGITVRPNPRASLYLHVVGSRTSAPVEPSRRDVDVIRFGIEQFVPMLPLFFEKGVHEQWTASARELVADAGPELRKVGAQLCREILALIEDAERSAPAHRGRRKPARPAVAPRLLGRQGSKPSKG